MTLSVISKPKSATYFSGVFHNHAKYKSSWNASIRYFIGAQGQGHHSR